MKKQKTESQFLLQIFSFFKKKTFLLHRLYESTVRTVLRRLLCRLQQKKMKIQNYPATLTLFTVLLSLRLVRMYFCLFYKYTLVIKQEKHFFFPRKLHNGEPLMSIWAVNSCSKLDLPQSHGRLIIICWEIYYSGQLLELWLISLIR